MCRVVLWLVGSSAVGLIQGNKTSMYFLLSDQPCYNGMDSMDEDISMELVNSSRIGVLLEDSYVVHERESLIGL